MPALPPRFFRLLPWGLSFLCVLSALVVWQLNPQADIIGVDPGMCNAVETDPETGLKLVYCCLDELYQMRAEGLTEEAQEFLLALQRTQTMSEEEVIDFFESPYDSTLHRKYGWTNFCGAEVACETCTVSPACGNSVKQDGEECDEGDKNSDTTANACRTDCTLPACGDGLVDSVTEEECDDGNTVGEDGCSSTCRREGNSTSSESQQSSEGAVSSVVILLPSSSSSSVGSKSSDEPYLEPPSSESSSSFASSATASVSSSAEIVDVLTSSSPQALPEGTFIGFYGNGIIEVGEECDSTFGCLNGTLVISTEAFCGDKILQSPEECEGNTLGCIQCSIVAGTHLTCGDGILTTTEQCDDGNIVSLDGCSASCRSESAIITGEFCNANGTRESSEECDDGNHTDGDGCGATCFFESGRRGDGVIQRALGERCEPLLSSVPCSPEGKFILEDCGNGVLNPRESCDRGPDNSQASGSLCRSDCSLAGCGDGVLDPTEECDDGNLVSGDSCDRLCMNTQSSPPPRSSAASVPVSNPNTPTHTSAPSVPKTGPAALVIVAVGSAAAVGWLKRRGR